MGYVPFAADEYPGKLLYMGIGIVQNAIEQALMLGATPNVSLRASAVVYGLMAISLLWAPQNNLDGLKQLIFKAKEENPYDSVDADW